MLQERISYSEVEWSDNYQSCKFWVVLTQVGPNFYNFCLLQSKHIHFLIGMNGKLKVIVRYCFRLVIFEGDYFD